MKDTAKGSARSINGFNIYEALKKLEDMLVQFGGHCHAAGLEIQLDRIDEFRIKFNEIAKSELLRDEFRPEIVVDLEIKFEDINPTFTRIISFFEPFGPGNTQPTFITRNVKIVEEVKYTKTDAHIFKVSDGNTDRVWNAVFYNSKDYEGKLIPGVNCDICYSIDKNTYNGYTKLLIKDLKIL